MTLSHSQWQLRHALIALTILTIITLQLRPVAADDNDALHHQTSGVNGVVIGSSSEEQTVAEKEVKYLVGLLRNPMMGDTPSGGRVIQMTSKSGARFTCVIPDPTIEPAKQEATIDERIEEVAAKVKASYGRGCFTKTKEYWTYEVCPFKSVRQFHKDGETVSMEFSLGLYNKSNEISLSSTGIYSQQYTSGTGDRQTIVRYVCHDDPGASKGLLTTVSEPKPFHYEMEIRTSLGCLAPKGESTPEALLSSLTECAHLNTGWWTYKFCYGKQVSQFHRESVEVKNTAAQSSPVPASTADQQAAAAPPKMEMITTVEYDLGRLPEETVPIVIVKGDTPKETYASQWYQDGTKCDVTNRPRKTEVRFYCDPAETQVIRTIKETSSCEYMMVVASQYLCSHILFAPDLPKVREIACSPMEKARSIST